MFVRRTCNTSSRLPSASASASAQITNTKYIIEPLAYDNKCIELYVLSERRLLTPHPHRYSASTHTAGYMRTPVPVLKPARGTPQKWQFQR